MSNSDKFIGTVDYATTTFIGDSNDGYTLENSMSAVVLTVDGIVAVVGDLILVKDQMSSSDNGIYQVTRVNSVVNGVGYQLQRVCMGVEEIYLVFVRSGATQAQTLWYTDLGTPPYTPGVTAQVFTQIPLSGDVTMQDAYDNTTPGDPQIVLDAAHGAMNIRDAAVPLGANLFEVQDNAGATDYFSVDATGATVDGKLTVTGLIDPTGLQCSEQAANPGVVAAGNGTFWVRDDAPNVPIFTDDAGTDHNLLNAVGVNLQQAYDAGPTGEMNLDAAIGGVIISDEGGGGIGANLFEIQDTTTAVLLAVDATSLAVNVDTTITGKLTVTGLIDPTGLQLTEQAANPGVVAAGNGTFWAKDDSPNVPVFTDDSGTDYVLNTFIDDTDTPGAYVADAILAVNSGGTAVEFTNNWKGTNTNAAGSSVAIGGSSSVGAIVDATAVGAGATVTGARGVAIGHDSNAILEGTAMGDAASAAGTRSIAIGNAATTAGAESVSMGDAATGSGDMSVAIGNATVSGGLQSVAIGDASSSAGDTSVSIGEACSIAATADRSVAIGNACVLIGSSLAGVAIGDAALIGVGGASTGAIAIGDAAEVGASGTSNNAIAIGTGAAVGSTAGASNGIAIGTGATAPTGASGVAIGNIANAGMPETVAIGDAAVCTGARTIAIGNAATCAGSQSVSIGDAPSAAGDTSVAIGDACSIPAAADRSVAIGRACALTGASIAGIAIGDAAVIGAGAASTGAIAIGDAASVGSTGAADNGIAIGTGADASTGSGGVAIGNTASASVAETVAIGDVAVASGTRSIAMGNASTCAGSQSVAIGDAPSVAGDTSVAIGDACSIPAAADRSVAIGNACALTGASVAGVAIGDAATIGSGVASANSIAIGDGASTGTVSAADGSIALGFGAIVSGGTAAMAMGVSATNDISETLVMNAMPMVHNTSSTGILSGAAWAGAMVPIASGVVDLTSVATGTITLPAGLQMFVNQIDIIKLNVSDTPTAATIDFGITGDEDAFISGLSFGSAAENTVGARTINTALLRTDGVTSLVIDVTAGGTVASGVHEARVVFMGYILHDE